MLNHQQYCFIDHLIRQVATGSMSSQQFKGYQLNPEFMLGSKYKYSEAIHIYAEAMQLLKSKKGCLSCDEMYEYTFEYITSQEKRITDQDAYYRRCEEKNQNSLQTYLAKLLDHYARLLFVRVDFAIQKKYQAEIDIEQFHAYLQVMSNRYSNQDGCFANLQGFAWAIEEGVDKGLHCHTLLIFDGNRHDNDYGVAKKICDYWGGTLVDGASSFNCNHSKYKQKFIKTNKLGIGMIHRNHLKEVQNALNAAQYLVNPEKELQHLRVRLPRMRTFGTGRFEIKKRRGIKKPI